MGGGIEAQEKGGAELRQRKEHGEGKPKGRDDSHGDGREEKVTVSKKKDAGGPLEEGGGGVSAEKGERESEDTDED